jgi:energy-coupling factor transport system ATP-binding protein
MESAVKFVNYSWTYEGANKPALSNINLELEKNKYIAITGPSGCGKTTFLLSINGLIPHSIKGNMDGKVIVLGIDTRETSVTKLAKKVGMVFQNPETQLFTTMVVDEIVMGLENAGLEPEEMKRRLEKVINQFGLKGLEKRAPSELSDGQKQRVAFAAALALQPEILVLDAPTSDLDPRGTQDVVEALSIVSKQLGMTVIDGIAHAHKIDDVVVYADRVIVLDKGKVIADGHPREVFKESERFIEIGLRPPQVCELMVRLSKLMGKDLGPLPLTVEEASDQLSKLIPKGKNFPKQYHSSTQLNSSQIKGEPIIKARNLRFIYQPANVEALKGINVDIYPGEFIALVGENGAGKTTFAKNVLGLLKPTSGTLIVDGVDPRTAEIQEMAKRVGYLFQNPDNQLFQLTVWDEVCFGPKNLGLSPEEIEERAKEAIRLCRLQGLEKEAPLSLSTGERQRLALAAVLAMDTKILFLDEPTKGQDYGNIKSFMDFIVSLNKDKGKTIILITHDMTLVAEYARRVIVMSKGNIVLDGTPWEVLQHEDIIKEAGLNTPPIAQVAKNLSIHGVPSDIMTVDEMVDFFKKYIIS